MAALHLCNLRHLRRNLCGEVITGCRIAQKYDPQISQIGITAREFARFSQCKTLRRKKSSREKHLML